MAAAGIGPTVYLITTAYAFNYSPPAFANTITILPHILGRTIHGVIIVKILVIAAVAVIVLAVAYL